MMGNICALSRQYSLSDGQRFHVYRIVVELNGIKITHGLTF